MILTNYNYSNIDPNSTLSCQNYSILFFLNTNFNFTLKYSLKYYCKRVEKLRLSYFNQKKFNSILTSCFISCFDKLDLKKANLEKKKLQQNSYFYILQMLLSLRPRQQRPTRLRRHHSGSGGGDFDGDANCLGDGGKGDKWEYKVWPCSRI